MNNSENIQWLADYICNELKDDVTKKITIPPELVLWLDGLKKIELMGER